MSFRVVKDRPRGSARRKRCGPLAVTAARRSCTSKKSTALSREGIGLRTSCFQTHERSVGTELGMVTGLLVRDVKAQRFEAKLPGALPVFKIELYSHKPRRNSAHKPPGPLPIVLLETPAQSIWNEGPLAVVATSSRRFATARAT